MNDKELARCRARLVQYLEDLLAPLGRRDRRHWGEVYIRGLLLEGERKSIEPLAQRLPEGNVQALQQLVGQSPWPEAPVRAHLARRLAQELTPGAAWVVDEVGFPKQGKHSVGVARQYCGTLGKVGNCQVAVSLNHTTDDGSFPVDWRLYLPESWIRDPARCAAAGVPDGTPFQTKWELALACCDQARARGVPDGVVLADAAYGSVTAFREGLEARRLRYVVDGDSTLTAWPTPQTRHPVPYPGPGRRPKPQYLGPPPQALAALAAGLPRTAWRTIRWREGTKQGLESRFAALRVQPAQGSRAGAPEQPMAWLLIAWPPRRGGPDEVLAVEPPGRHHPAPARAVGEEPLVHRAGLPAAQARAGAGPLRGPWLAGLASPRDSCEHRVRVPRARGAPDQKKLLGGPCRAAAGRSSGFWRRGPACAGPAASGLRGSGSTHHDLT